ncbi:MAG TPA: tetratricopeptide repeat protein [Thermoanaerobaculia bacterium]|nr:tetratricopeptide repeat protein [Thermoanaerobaculia bacterium]
MPATINGIGTHYYGAKSKSSHLGTCGSCGRAATLTSYDTREWFCFAFIPLIPIRKFRILDECSSCQRHNRLSAAEFSRQLAETTAPMREAMRRSPRDPQPYAELIHTLVGWGMRTEAERELDSAVALFPQNVDLILLASQLAADRADYERALSFYQAAYQAAPQNSATSYGCGWTLYHLERHEEAVPMLQRAASFDESKRGALYLLGLSQKTLSRWNEALHAFQQLLSLEPGYAQDKKFLRLIRECKEKLGYELTDAERRAGRSWWPFGRKKKWTGPKEPAMVRPALKWAGLALLVLIAAAWGFTAWDEQKHIDVYVDNGLDRPVHAELGALRFDLGPSSHRLQKLGPGAHTIVVREQDGKDLERHSFNIAEASLWDTLWHDRFFVYNIAARRVYRRAVHGYAKNAEDSSYDEELVALQRFFEQRDVDYAFTSVPESIKIDSRTSGAVKKVAFSPADDVDLAAYAVIRAREGKSEEAKTAIERAVSTSPCHNGTRRTQIYMAGLFGSNDGASVAARQWVRDCGETDVDAHRAYQDVFTSQGRRDALREEYRKLLDGSPQSGRLHYLYGRVAKDPKVSIDEHEQALRLDPKLVWPRVALGHVLAEEGRYDDAIREYDTALAAGGYDPSVVSYYAMVWIAKGDPGGGVARIDEIRKRNPDDYHVLQARWLLALAMGEWLTAEQMQKSLARFDDPLDTFLRGVRLARLRGDAGIDARLEEAMRQEELRGVAAQERIQRLLEKRAFAEAEMAIAQAEKTVEPAQRAMLQAYTAAGYLLQGDARAADKLLASAAKNAGDDRLTGAVVQGLQGKISPEEVMSMMREYDATEYGWFVTAVRAAVAKDRAAAARSFDRTIRASSTLGFPYLEAKSFATLMQ